MVPMILLAALLAVAAAPPAAPPDYARIFAGRDGCFELYDLAAGKLVVRSDPRRCAERASPCSTFKVPLALMAYDAGILEDERSSMKWDGKDYGRSAWNRDQTAATWMRDSVVWFSQRLTPQLGMERVERYLAAFEFGNRDMSGGLTRAWLDSSLAVSPDEELRFLERLWRGDLSVSKRALETTKALMLVETTPAGWTLHGKTGSGRLGGAGSGRFLGWFVGHVGRGGRDYVFVTSFSDRAPSRDDRPPGFVARDMTKEILAVLGLR